MESAYTARKYNGLSYGAAPPRHQTYHGNAYSEKPDVQFRTVLPKPYDFRDPDDSQYHSIDRTDIKQTANVAESPQNLTTYGFMLDSRSKGSASKPSIGSYNFNLLDFGASRIPIEEIVRIDIQPFYIQRLPHASYKPQQTYSGFIFIKFTNTEMADDLRTSIDGQFHIACSVRQNGTSLLVTPLHSFNFTAPKTSHGALDIQLISPGYGPLNMFKETYTITGSYLAPDSFMTLDSPHGYVVNDVFAVYITAYGSGDNVANSLVDKEGLLVTATSSTAFRLPPLATLGYDLSASISTGRVVIGEYVLRLEVSLTSRNVNSKNPLILVS